MSLWTIERVIIDTPHGRFVRQRSHCECVRSFETSPVASAAA
jgi:hypothetical protein